MQQDKSDSETLFITPWGCPLVLHLIWLNCGLLPKGGVPHFILSSRAPQAAGCLWSFVSQNTKYCSSAVCQINLLMLFGNLPLFFCRIVILRISEHSQLTLRPHDWRVQFYTGEGRAGNGNSAVPLSICHGFWWQSACLELSSHCQLPFVCFCTTSSV